MNRIEQKFQDLQNARRKAFIAFITAGDPDLETTVRLAPALERAGADILELGVPFSDPLADGPTIQASSARALRGGVTVRGILEAAARIREQSALPLALMTYYNPVFHFGEEKFVTACRKAGVDGLIVPDLPPEEAGNLIAAARGQDIATVFFVAPTTRTERMALVARAATGFIYYVSVAGVTGARSVVPADLAARVRQARRLGRKPVCVGFGVSTPEQVLAVSRVADGVIVGSAIVREIGNNRGRKDLVSRVSGFVERLAAPLKEREGP
jgi:tryptophan synthase alpha chain